MRQGLGARGQGSGKGQFLAPGPWPLAPRSVGLLGGSFNPPHEGHVFISAKARRAAKLDRVWWLVSPQNPLKSARDTAPLSERFARCQAMAKGYPWLVPTMIESQCGTRYSVDIVRILRRRFPRVRFVFILGMDSLISLHRWKRAWELVNLVELVVVDRPGFLHRAVRSRFGVRLRRYTGRASYPGKKSQFPYVRYVFGPRHSASSTRIRNSDLKL